MALIVGHNGSSHCTTIANRTGQSGGSVGGVKKAGLFGGSTYWSMGNSGNAVFYRAPQRQPTLAQMYLLTTRNPTQGSAYQVYRRGI